MKILILNGSPRANGSTVKMIRAFAKGAEEAGNEINLEEITEFGSSMKKEEQYNG